MDHEDSGKAALFAPGINGNYAFGGARARSCIECLAPGFSAQIAMFLGHYGGADSDALYVAQFGGNDVRDVLLWWRYQHTIGCDRSHHPEYLGTLLERSTEFSGR